MTEIHAFPALTTTGCGDVGVSFAELMSPLAMRHKLIGLRLIAPLLKTCRPSAVPWLVVPIVIDAVDRVLGRRLPSHVGKEVEIRVEPTLADRDASASVAVVHPVARIQAALFHAYPRQVLRRHPALRLPVKVVALANRVKRVTKPQPATVVNRTPSAQDGRLVTECAYLHAHSIAQYYTGVRVG